ncbi:hypothetical protein [Achromobacter sp. E1]|uniref:hypothetical protein n=1 Tax=Achromobacter sp. E1 TaxID=3141581 RepID=UPI0030D33EC4
MTTKHTPGPWAPHLVDETIVVIPRRPLPQHISTLGHSEVADDEDYANARLIAAAPELYEALDALFTDMLIAQGNMRDAAKRDHRWEGCADEIQPRIDAARAALAKARGAQ